MTAAPGVSALRMLRQVRDRIDRDYADPVGIAGPYGRRRSRALIAWWQRGHDRPWVMVEAGI